MVWRADFETALEEAVLLRQPVFLTFYTDWCGWCRKLEAQTFRDPEFVKTSSRYVTLRLNGDKERGLASMFRVTSYPTTIILNRRGKELGRVIGYKPPDQFTRILMAGMGRREDLQSAFDDAEANPDNVEAAYALGDVYLALGKYREAGEQFTRIQALDRENASHLADDAQLDLALAVFLGGESKRSLPMFQAFFERYADSDRRDQGLYFYGLALRGAGDNAASLDPLNEAARTTSLTYIQREAGRLTAEE